MNKQHYLNEGTITHDDIENVLTETCAMGYPETGWTDSLGNPTTLREQAELWAEQENECKPEDRMSFLAFLSDRLADENITPPDSIPWELCPRFAWEDDMDAMPAILCH